MPLLILAGVHQGLVTRSRGFIPKIAGWDVLLCHSRSSSVPDLRTCWSDVLSAADNLEHDGAHILAFHFYDQDRKEFELDVYGRHRLVWLDRSLLAKYGTQSFTHLLRTLAEFEDVWRCRVRPSDVRSALMLPESTFAPRREVDALWRRAHRLQVDRDNVSAVGGLAKRFREEHYARGYWVDIRDRRFDPAASRHATHGPPGHRWKFTFEVPPGFHFDVSAESGGSFSVRDHAGVVRRFAKYTNVDCHGHVRGGG